MFKKLVILVFSLLVCCSYSPINSPTDPLDYKIYLSNNNDTLTLFSNHTYKYNNMSDVYVVLKDSTIYFKNMYARPHGLIDLIMYYQPTNNTKIFLLYRFNSLTNNFIYL